MPAGLRWVLGVLVVAVVAGVPFALYRAEYAHAKRLREVAPGRFYRSGQLTAGGFREAFDKYKIKSVVNLQHEAPDPLLPDNWMGKPRIRESEVCGTGVKYFLITPDILPEPNTPETQPPAVKQFLDILDDESNYPVLIHCKAGLHRTGRLTAIYRMEYGGWSVGAAVRELRANGFGYTAVSESDPYVVQFVQNYKPRPRVAGKLTLSPDAASAAAASPKAYTAGGRQ